MNTVLAEATLGDALMQVVIGGSDEPHIDLQSPSTAKPFEFFILQDPVAALAELQSEGLPLHLVTEFLCQLVPSDRCVY